MRLAVLEEIQKLVDRGAIFYLSHSGGKDSQCMTLEMSKLVPKNQIVIIHAHLPGVEWKGTRTHIKNTIGDLQYLECQAVKTFFGMVEHRQRFPAPKYRQCTSDLKRGPIEKAIRVDLKSKGKTLAVSCMGLRAQESTKRAKAVVFKKHTPLSKAGREAYNLLPIHSYLEEDVFETIAYGGQKPHWAYSKGMGRLSCCFCIMASQSDLTIAAKINPDLYRKYAEKEKELGFTLQQGKTLEETTGIYL